MPETFCAPCRSIECTNPADNATYSLQSGIVFTSGVLSAVASCPEGFICPNGIYPRAFTYPDDRWTIPVPPPVIASGGPILLRGCESDIVRIIPAGATQAQLQAIANQMFQEAAQQQARCDAEADPNNRRVIVNEFEMTEFEPTMACQSEAFSTTVETNSATATFSIVGTLPPGLALTQSDNVATISGTPTTIGTTVFAIKAVSGSNQAVQQITFTVIGIATASPLPDGFVGTAYSQTLTAPSMGTVGWVVSAGALPNGLLLNPTTGEISGTPTATGTFNFTVTAATT